MGDNFGPWRTIGSKWVLQLGILQRLLISIGAPRTFLLVILDFLQYFIVIVVFLSYGQIVGVGTICCLSFLFSGNELDVVP